MTKKLLRYEGKKSAKDLEFKDLLALKEGTVLIDAKPDNWRCRYVVLRSTGSLTAYVGVKKDSALAGFNYEDIPISCHGGLTFSNKGGGWLPAGYYWYGWDYAHSGDFTFYDAEGRFNVLDKNDHRWTVAEVDAEAAIVAYDMKKLETFAKKLRSQQIGLREMAKHATQIVEEERKKQNGNV